MRNLLCLPSTLLLLLATCSWSTAAADDALLTPLENASRAPQLGLEEDWMRNTIQARRDDAIRRRMLGQPPVAVRKMSNDPSEKFYPEYWQFGIVRPVPDEVKDMANASMTIDLYPPLLPHSDDFTTSSTKLRSFPRNIFEKRAYKCPTGTNSCSSIGHPDSCCATDETCMIITDTGLGNVGCCPSGEICGGSVASCNTAAGYTSCPDSSNGGCCIPGYECDSIGCIVGATTIVTATGSYATTAVIPATTVVTSYQQVVTTAVVVLTQVVTITTSSSVAILTVYVTTTTPTSTAYVGISTAQTTVYTTITEAVPAERPTSGSSSSSVTTTVVTTTVLASTVTSGYCPTGFYQCSAYYEGGCCQVGVNCDTSSCDTSGSTEVVTGSVVTIVVATGYGVTTITTTDPPAATTVLSTITPTTSTSTTTTIAAVVVVTASTTSVDPPSGTATCAAGWYGCADTDGGGCCPSGYSCAASCIATQNGEPGHVYKVPAISHGSPSFSALGKWFVVFAGVTGFGMIWF